MTEMLKNRARKAVSSAVASGRLIRPSKCQQCGAVPPRRLDGRAGIHGHHHKGYVLALDVMWLCAKCHFQYDPRPNGERNGRAKLSVREALEIRARYKSGRSRWHLEGSAAELARDYGVSVRTVRRIVAGEIWSDAILSEPQPPAGAAP